MKKTQNNHLYCFLTAVMIITSTATSTGKNISASRKIDINALENKANGGDGQSQLKLAELYDEGKDTQKDPIKAIYWYEKASEQGVVEAQTNLGIYYSLGLDDIPVDKSKALQYFKKAAETGYADGQFFLANLYNDKEFEEKDQIKAFEWYKKASDQGHIDATHQLAYCYERGLGVTKDELIAIDLYEKASTNGSVLASFALAEMYEDGKGVPENQAKANELFRKAKTQNPDFYSIMKGARDSFPKKQKKKFNLPDNVNVSNSFKSELAKAEAGDKDSQFAIGSMYETGWCTDKDKAKAIEWYKKAASQGHELAKDTLRFLPSDLRTPTLPSEPKTPTNTDVKLELNNE